MYFTDFRGASSGKKFLSLSENTQRTKKKHKTKTKTTKQKFPETTQRHHKSTRKPLLWINTSTKKQLISPLSSYYQPNKTHKTILGSHCPELEMLEVPEFFNIAKEIEDEKQNKTKS